MTWEKIGKIFEVNEGNKNRWMQSHSAVPLAMHLREDIYRVYFSTRDEKNTSSLSSFDCDINNPTHILNVSKEPKLTSGKLGAFDDSGVMASAYLKKDDAIYLYYIGWNLGTTVPFRNSIGLAKSLDCGETFERCFEGPILDRTKDEPYFVASSHVIFDEGVYKIWYLSCTGWEIKNNKPSHHYHIKYATSKDGIDWDRKGIVAIDYKDAYEYAISVPRIVKEKGIYKMWFSSRATEDTSTYRIRYAESKDGINWERKDKSIEHLNVSDAGWDSEMMCYPYVFDHKDTRYMLYNGNGYGKSGIGLAVWKD